jgi:flagellar biosynthesis protein FliP
VTGSLILMGVATIGVAGLVLVLGHLLRTRLGPHSSSLDRGEGIHVVRRVGLGPRQGLALIQVGSERLLVSCGEGGVRLVCRVASEQSGPQEAPPSLGPDGPEGPGSCSSVSSESAWGGERPFRDMTTLPAKRPAAPFGNPISARLQRILPFLGLLALLVLPSSGDALSTSEFLGSETGAVVLPSEGPQAQEAPSTAQSSAAEEGGQLPSMELRLGDGEGDERLSVSGPVGAVILIGFLTLIPTLLLLMTSFTRILIVLHLLRQALGAQAAPPAHLLSALALLLTGFVMAPALSEANDRGIQPWMAGEMDEVEMLEEASVPFRTFMLRTAHEEDLALFIDLWGGEVPEDLSELPLVVVASAFVTSELRVAFQMGFMLFLPFVVIDLVVASVLMSMGMFMLPPLMVSLPFKLLLFVLVDGWGLMVGSLIQSFP